jgi:hypothetical protein
LISHDRDTTIVMAMRHRADVAASGVSRVCRQHDLLWTEKETGILPAPQSHGWMQVSLNGEAGMRPCVAMMDVPARHLVAVGPEQSTLDMLFGALVVVARDQANERNLQVREHVSETAIKAYLEAALEEIAGNDEAAKRNHCSRTRERGQQVRYGRQGDGIAQALPRLAVAEVYIGEHSNPARLMQHQALWQQ